MLVVGIIPRKNKDMNISAGHLPPWRCTNLQILSGSKKTELFFQAAQRISATVLPVEVKISQSRESTRFIPVGSLSLNAYSAFFINYRDNCSYKLFHQYCLDSPHSCRARFFFYDLEPSHFLRVFNMRTTTEFPRIQDSIPPNHRVNFHYVWILFPEGSHNSWVLRLIFIHVC